MPTKLREIQDRLATARAELVRAVRALDTRAIPEALRLCDAIEDERKAENEAIRRRLAVPVDTRRLAPGARCTECEALLFEYEGSNPEGLYEWYEGGRHVCELLADKEVGRE